MLTESGTPPSRSLRDAYDHCWAIASRHYENFTLGSRLLPRDLRRHIAAIYAFARSADDLADEGHATSQERLVRLAAYETQLELCVAGRAAAPLFVALGETIRRFELPLDLFRALLAAFRRDAEFRPFETFDQLRDYCRQSADPVGRLVLRLFGYRDAERAGLADRICTGLQLTNFWQDLAVDARKGRLYVPLEDIGRFGCTRAELQRGVLTAPVRKLIAFEVDRARRLLLGGLPLAGHVAPRLAREVRLFAWGGLAVLRGIETVDYDVYRRRPTVSGTVKVALLLRAVLTREVTPAALARPIAPQEEA